MAHRTEAPNLSPLPMVSPGSGDALFYEQYPASPRVSKWLAVTRQRSSLIDLYAGRYLRQAFALFAILALGAFESHHIAETATLSHASEIPHRFDALASWIPPDAAVKALLGISCCSLLVLLAALLYIALITHQSLVSEAIYLPLALLQLSCSRPLFRSKAGGSAPMPLPSRGGG